MNKNGIKKLLECYEKHTEGIQIISDPAGRPLEWYKTRLSLPWEEAMFIAENIIINGGGWQLPNLGELRGLYRVREETKNNLGLGCPPEIGGGCEVWSCESKDEWAAWVFNFTDGNAYPGTKGHAMYRKTFLVRQIGG